MAYPNAFPAYQPPQGGFPYQMTNYPPQIQNVPTAPQNGQGWGYAPPPPPPQETELDILKRILLTLEEIQKGMVKHGPDE